MKWIIGVDTKGAGIGRQRFAVDIWGTGVMMWMVKVDAQVAEVTKSRITGDIGKGEMKKEATVDAI